MSESGGDRDGVGSRGVLVCDVHACAHGCVSKCGDISGNRGGSRDSGYDGSVGVGMCALVWRGLYVCMYVTEC